MPTNDPAGSWDTGSGLITDYEGDVVEAYFGTDSRVDNGNRLMLFLKVKPTDPDIQEEVDTEDGLIEERYNVGKTTDWDSPDGGMTCEHTSGKAKKINNKSQFGKFLDKVVGLIGRDDVATTIGANPLYAPAWVGCRFYFEEQTEKYTIDGKDITSSRNFPTEFRGKHAG